MSLIAAPLTVAGKYEVEVGSWNLPGFFTIPENAFGLIVFAHGSGSSHSSPRNNFVAEQLNHVGLATLLFDLLHPTEEAAQNRAKVFDITLLAERLMDAVGWADQAWADEAKPVGLFGASTGAAAALVAAAELGNRVDAVVSRGGRPDLAGDALQAVRAPSLLIVGGADREVLECNRDALRRITGTHKLEIVPGATHLFPEPGAMNRVTQLAMAWFERYLA